MVFHFLIQALLQARNKMAKTRKEQPKPLSRKSQNKRKKLADNNLEILNKLSK